MTTRLIEKRINLELDLNLNLTTNVIWPNKQSLQVTYIHVYSIMQNKTSEYENKKTKKTNERETEYKGQRCDKTNKRGTKTRALMNYRNTLRRYSAYKITITTLTVLRESKVSSGDGGRSGRLQ